jgi:hypothetical protein
MQRCLLSPFGEEERGFGGASFETAFGLLRMRIGEAL